MKYVVFLSIYFLACSNTTNNNSNNNNSNENSQMSNKSRKCFSDKKVNYKIFVNKIDFVSSNSEIDLDKIPTLFFDVKINSKGDIIKVEYNSWGQSIYGSLIIDLKKYLLTRSIEPYQIMGYPIATELTIEVSFAKGVLPVH